MLHTKEYSSFTEYLKDIAMYKLRQLENKIMNHTATDKEIIDALELLNKGGHL